jgi:beta-mannanase
VLTLSMVLTNSFRAAPVVHALEIDPPRPVALGVYQPVFPDDLAVLSEYEHASGGRLAIVHWYAHWTGWKSAFSRTDLETAARHGSVPMVTWEPWPGATTSTAPDETWSLRNGILSGRFDAYIDEWARGMEGYGKPILLRFAHEMHHNSVYPWAVGANGNTADDYVAAWRHVRGIFARYHTSNVKWVWNPHTIPGATADGYANVFAALYPGDDSVDWLGLDVYNTGPQLDWGAPYWRTFTEALAEPYQAITTLSDKPLMLAEVGCTESTGRKGEWITSALGVELGNFPSVRALIWFDVDKEQPWELHSSPAALEAWTSVSRSSRFKAAPLQP